MSEPRNGYESPVVLPGENPALVAELADRNSDELGIPDFASFLDQRLGAPVHPRRPVKAEYSGPNKTKRLVFDAVNDELALLHNKQLSQYEKEKRRFDLLNAYPATLAGYGSYLVRHHPHVLDFFGTRRPFCLAPKSRRLHTYLVGGAGSGKTECLKSFIWYYLHHEPKSAIVYIDPHHDAAEQVAMFKVNRDSDRLAYIKPALDETKAPGLNPFDIPDKEKLSDRDAETYAGEFLSAFREILEGDLTSQMEMLLKFTIPVLVKMPGTSIYDLIEFLRPKAKQPKPAKDGGDEAPASEYAAERYLRFAHENFKNRVMLKFLSTQFEDDSSFVVTRNSLATRLHTIFGSTEMQSLFSGTRTVRIEELVRQRKLVVFNLADLDQTEIVGKFIVISIKIFAIKQSKVPKHARIPCHLIVDECQKFITKSMGSILNEARKFAVYLTLAQQSVGAGMDPELLDSVLTNAATKISGFNGGSSVTTMVKEMETDEETIRGLQAGQFVVYQRFGRQKSAIVRMPKNTLDNRAGMSASEWREILQAQKEAYYRSPDDAEAPTDSWAHVDVAPAKRQREQASRSPLAQDIDAFLN